MYERYRINERAAVVSWTKVVRNKNASQTQPKKQLNTFFHHKSTAFLAFCNILSTLYERPRDMPEREESFGCGIRGTILL